MDETVEIDVNQTSARPNYNLYGQYGGGTVYAVTVFIGVDDETPLLYLRGAYLEQRFSELAKKWREETGGMSSITQRVLNKYYQDILQLGPDIVPILIRDLAKKPDDWLYILNYWVRDNNPTQNVSSFTKSVDAWIQYGRDQGML